VYSSKRLLSFVSYSKNKVCLLGRMLYICLGRSESKNTTSVSNKSKKFLLCRQWLSSFRTSKKHLGFRSFHADAAVREWLLSQSPELYADGIIARMPHSDKCLNLQGDCVEKAATYTACAISFHFQ
jgi:hypothetical protein